MITNLINSNGRAVANQFVITDMKDGLVARIAFQSYDSLVCEIVPNCGMGFDCLVRFGRDFDYSRTTMKHLIKFLSDFPTTSELKCIADVRNAIERGYLRHNQSIAVLLDNTMH